MDDRLNKIEEKLNELDKQVSLLTQSQKNYDGRFDKIEASLDKITEKLGDIVTTITEFKASKSKYNLVDFGMNLVQDLVKYAVLGGLLYYFLKGGI